MVVNFFGITTKNKIDIRTFKTFISDKQKQVLYWSNWTLFIFILNKIKQH